MVVRDARYHSRAVRIRVYISACLPEPNRHPLHRILDDRASADL